LRGAEKEAVIREALSAAMNIDQKAPRAEVLAGLAPQLSGGVKESALRDALSAARGIGGLIRAQGDEARAKVVARLAPELSGPLLAEALSVAREMEFGRARAEALAALTSKMTAPGKEAILRAELAEAQNRGSQWERAEVLAGLASQLSGPLLAEALSLARRIDDKASQAKARALTALASQLSGAEKEAALAEALSAAHRIEHKESCALALAALASQLSGPEKDSVLTAALSAARESEGDEPCAEALAVLAPQLSGPLLAQALTVARAIEDESCQARVVEAIAQKARDRGELLEELRRCIVDRLWSTFSRGERREVYEICSNEHLFRPPLVSQQVLERIAIQIGEIGLRWRWP